MEFNRSTEIDELEGIDIKYLFDLLLRSFWIIVMGLFLGAAVAFAISRYQTPIYQATTQVMVTRSSSSGPVTDVTQALNVQQLSETYVELLSQKWVRDSVAERIGGEIGNDQIKISAAANTQIIEISVEDPSPARAVTISNTLVQVLIEQNESIQSGRYTTAEASLNLQIQDIEQKIGDLQALKEVTKEGEVDQQIARAQENMIVTQSKINGIEAEIARLEELGTETHVRQLLSTAEGIMRSHQAVLDDQLAEYQSMQDQLPTVIPAEPDPEIVAIQSKMAELGVEINGTREKIDKVQQEIDLLSPLTEDGSIAKAMVEQQNLLAVQEALLESYKGIITDLVATRKPLEVTDTITSVEENLNLYQDIYLNLLNNRETVRLERLQNMPNVVQLTPALASDEPVRPRTLLNTALGSLIGLVLAVVGVLFVDFLDTTIKTREDIERVLQLPVMGYMLHMNSDDKEQIGPYVLHAPRSPAAEAFRSLRTNLEFISVDKPLKSILVSSPGASEGKTTMAANLAVVMAQSGKRVVLMDADLRRPRLHREMGLVNRIGLSEVFRNKVTLRDVYQPWEGGLPLSIITSGGIPPNPSELLASAKMRQILDELEETFDFVIIDSTPIIVTDSQLIAARVNGVLLVLWPGRTNAEAARITVEQYRRVGAHMLGVIMNNAQAGSGYYGNYAPYSSYHYYQYAGDGSSQSGRNGGFKLPWKRRSAARNGQK